MPQKGENGDGGTTELIETIADDKAIDVEAWLDARTFLLGYPKRLVVIAGKRVKGRSVELRIHFGATIEIDTCPDALF